MEKKPFFTEEFYNNPQSTINILNDLGEADLIELLDTYGNKTLFFVEATNCLDTRKILGPIISDIDAYWKENNASYDESKLAIPLNLLNDEFTNHFKSDIYYDAETETFYY